METKQRTFMKEFLEPFVMTALTLSVLSFFITIAPDFKVSVLDALALFGFGFSLAYYYACVERSDNCIWRYTLYIGSIACLTMSGMSVWQLSLIWVI